MACVAAALLLVGFSVPSQERRTRSYFLSVSRLLQNVGAAVKAAPPFIVLLYFGVPPLPKKKLTRPGPLSRVNSESSMPILRKRHSRASALPVVSAIFGKSPSACERGSRVRFLSVRAVSAQEATVGTV